MTARRLVEVFVLTASLATEALSQEPFPSQSIEIIVPSGPGGGTDSLARQLAPLLQNELGVPVSVSNIPGHSGNAGLTKLLVNPPDGYTLAVLSAKTVTSWASGIGYARPPNFLALGIVQESSSMLFVPAGSRFQSVKDLLDYAKSNPLQVRIATGGYGTNDDLALRLLSSLGYRTINVPYARPEERYASLAGRRAHAIYEEVGDVQEFLKSKQWRPLVVFDNVRDSRFPDVPAIKEFGVTVGDMHDFRMLVAHAKTPADRIATLTAALRKVVESVEWKSFCTRTYTCTTNYDSKAANERVRRLHEEVRAKLITLPATEPAHR